ncbi:hypothetical protein F5Y01DRAFT_318330 [Xylaria sp. FL0043]|nr:hypothetical protein F5Y01DRAFT_318330 [Xylaria sp. FL0043]
MVTDPNVTLPMGRYKRGPNHIYRGINPATHPFYHLMAESVGKDVFYDNYLTARARNAVLGTSVLPEELVHGVQAVEASVDWTIHIFTIQHCPHHIGLEV